MSILPNTSAGAFKAIKDAIKDKIAGLPGNRKSYTRFRYADNLNQWVELAAVTIGDESRLQAVFIYLDDFTTAKKEARSSSVTAIFAIEIIYGFREGTEEDNSTLDFEDELGNINDEFLDADSLGFTDASSNRVLNEPITGDGSTGEGGARPALVDGVLAHRKVLNLSVTFRLCKGG